MEYSDTPKVFFTPHDRWWRKQVALLISTAETNRVPTSLLLEKNTKFKYIEGREVLGRTPVIMTCHNEIWVHIIATILWKMTSAPTATTTISTMTSVLIVTRMYPQQRRQICGLRGSYKNRDRQTGMDGPVERSRLRTMFNFVARECNDHDVKLKHVGRELQHEWWSGKIKQMNLTDNLCQHCWLNNQHTFTTGFNN
jgi:hypothetical protein